MSSTSTHSGSVRDCVVRILQDHQGSYVSGESIAQQLGVSRAAVWKAITSLRESGIEIQAVRNRGYQLAPTVDLLTTNGVISYLNDEVASLLHLNVVASTTSTNTVLKQQADSGAPEYTALVAGEQTQGKGRRGRPFYSPGDTGIYLSILLRPKMSSMFNPADLTCAAAVAVARAIEETTHIEAQIKWVNDVYVNGFKICGILTEAASDLESQTIDYAIPGIGVNLYAPADGFPSNCAHKAGYILDTPKAGLRDHLAASILNQFVSLYLDGSRGSYLDEYRQRSFLIGKEIDILAQDGSARVAKALSIGDDLSLLVKYNDGSEQRLTTGEVSIRLPEQRTSTPLQIN
ncbi:MAG: biotin--[acetyl-CoA-carboxylase] ligase [Eggerthellaceae bacterium]|jgi:BirA family biotin operon repressor/biotin-[acetyl-CoA-carboxylase] ligase|nr:biotin--[acetyl-CoA-carboxylase] ligase [Eggerthellaceae bacterium]MCH4220604.1 biotin--[acetyl-CoA-carboxylase] ligase [Eggerthellaceae bacterium]